MREWRTRMKLAGTEVGAVIESGWQDSGAHWALRCPAPKASGCLAALSSLVVSRCLAGISFIVGEVRNGAIQ
jgi:hypothetical protein